jgi:hypothetical protein
VDVQQLTRLGVEFDFVPGEVAALGQLGVLPRLERLNLGKGGQVEHWDCLAAVPWLQHQPRLTILTLAGCKVPGLLLKQLPASLEVLYMHKAHLFGRQPAALTQLSRLRGLSLTCQRHKRLPPWLSSLRRLVQLDQADNTDEASGWEVLAQLPMLRLVRAGWGLRDHILRHVPHTCW